MSQGNKINFPKFRHRLPSVQLSHTQAMKLLREVKPQIKGCVVGEFPAIERLARKLNYNLELVG